MYCSSKIASKLWYFSGLNTFETKQTDTLVTSGVISWSDGKVLT